jgi:cytoskeletal protein RodZ
MTDEQPQPQAPAPAASSAPAPSKGKSNTALIVIIVLVVVFGVLIGGGYMAYRFVKGKVKTALNDVTTTTTNSDGTTTTSSSSLTDDYSTSKDLTPADSFGKGINNDIKPILSSMYGGAKLSTVSSSADGASLYYLTKQATQVADGDKISAELQGKGYKQDSATSSGDGYVISLSKGTTSLILTSSDKNVVAVVASVSTSSDTDE